MQVHGLVVTSSFARQVKFENFFPIIIAEVLENVFEKIGKETILRMLDEWHSLTPDKIVEDPMSFIEGFEELVGSGAQVITKLVARQMHLKIGITQSEMSVGKR